MKAKREGATPLGMISDHAAHMRHNRGKFSAAFVIAAIRCGTIRQSEPIRTCSVQANAVAEKLK